MSDKRKPGLYEGLGLVDSARTRRPKPKPAHIPSQYEQTVHEVRELHKPRWDNCINACCSGEQCKHRSRLCNGCDEYWPCATARLVYAASELT